MRVTNSILLTALFLTVVQAHQAEQQAHQAAFEAYQQPTTTTTNNNDQHDQQSKPKQQQRQGQKQQGAPVPPPELTPEEFNMAKEGIRQILSQLPIQQFEPLVNTMDGYCSTFGALCTVACKERMTDDTADYEEEVKGSKRKAKPVLSLGCANPKALTIGTAGASCQCASFDMTDRINFAIVGGVVTTHSKESGDFGAEGILDAIKFLPAVPTFLSIIHVLQSVCFYVSFLDVLATNANPPSCPANGQPGGILGSVTGLIPGLGGVLSGIPVVGDLLGALLGTGGGKTPAPTPTPTTGGGGGIFGFLDGLFGGGGGAKTTTTPTPTPTPTTGGGGIFGFLDGIFGGGGGAKTTTTPTPTPTLTPTPTPTPTSGGGIADFFNGIFGGGKPKSSTTTTTTTTAATTTTTTTTPPTTTAPSKPTTTAATATTSATATTTTTAGGLWGWFGGIFGGGAKVTTTATTTTSKPAATPTISAIFTQLRLADITPTTPAPKAVAFTTTPPVPVTNSALNTGGSGVKSQTEPTLTSVTVVTTVKTIAAPSPTSKKGSGLFDVIPSFGLLSVIDGNGNVIEADEGEFEEEGGERRAEMSKEDDNEKDDERLKSNDGRVARIVRVQRRYAEKMNRDHQGRRDDV
ncbi:hypothetical protein BGZ96_006021 [Linnemannia gamsii]|uniref:Uncharacterized protein n=1 Tax=Linnemannia gamsii TaxID=64522 RepID=A0ABQ7KEB6_9FUNG|nr:hypothetical protein BGZ96_006021 [Linnemannia gamsii]